MAKNIINMTKKSSPQWYVNEFQASNLSQADFCRKHKIPDSSFSGWKKKYAPSLLNTKIKVSKKAVHNDTSKTLKRKHLNSQAQELNFLEIPNAMNFCTNTLHATCTIQRPDGMQLIIAAKDQQLASLLQVFLCYN
jgi:hypothetical protein